MARKNRWWCCACKMLGRCGRIARKHCIRLTSESNPLFPSSLSSSLLGRSRRTLPPPSRPLYPSELSLPIHPDVALRADQTLTRQRILSLYESIHALGIVHNDVEPRHIRYDASTGVGPFLIDFDGASFVGVGENDVHGLREREMVRVMAMLDGYQFESR